MVKRPAFLRALGATITASLLAVGPIFNPASAQAASVTEVTTVDDVVLTHCEYSQFLGAAIEAKYYGRVAATRKSWGYPASRDYYRSVEKPKVVSSYFSVVTYNKCAPGRTKKSVKDGFTFVSAWTGKKSLINWDTSVALSFPGGISFTGSASQTTLDRTVREKVSEGKDAHTSFTAVMNTTKLTWTGWKEVQHSTTPDGFKGAIMKVYVHPVVRWSGADGSDYVDWGSKSANLS